MNINVGASGQAGSHLIRQLNKTVSPAIAIVRNPEKPPKLSNRYDFIAEHRGGPLTKENHHRLIRWARECSEHVLFLFDGEMDDRLLYALETARKWENDEVPTGVAMKASLGAHEVARLSDNLVNQAVARSIGQAVATAHMADHCLGGSFYALKAVKLAKKDIEKERDWQNENLTELPSGLAEAIRKMWKKKEMDRRL